jgi:serine kinase of HPr protein (carbohydrate metabolism regulator)
MRVEPTIHATAVVLGDAGVLIRGPSGSGKSLLGRSLVEALRPAGRFAAIVADDRVTVEAAGGRLIARVPAVIAGQAEVRGVGIVPVDHEPAAVIRLVVDLVAADTVARMPEEDGRRVTIEGVDLARIAVPARMTEVAADIIRAALTAVRANSGP